jgi:hypothetical protein
MYTRQHGLEQNLFLAPGEGDKAEPSSPEPVVAGVGTPDVTPRVGLLGG